MTVLTNNERLDRVILDLDSRIQGVRSLCDSIIKEINSSSTLTAQRVEQIMDNFILHIDFFNRVSVRTDVVAEAKIQYDDSTYDTSIEFPAMVRVMREVLDHILTTFGTDSYWSVFQYDQQYVKTYNEFESTEDRTLGEKVAVQVLKTKLTTVRDFISVI